MSVKRVGVVFPSAAKKGDEKSEKTQEAGLAKVVTEMQSVHQAISDEIASLLKSNPLPEAIQTVLQKLKTINESSRGPELKDLAKAMKGGTLRSNPAKVERLMKDLNEDVNRVNGASETREKAVDVWGRDKAKKLLEEITKALPSGVDAKQVDLAASMDSFIKAQSKAGWRSFDASAEKLKTSVVDRVADIIELKRLDDLRQVNNFFRQTLRYRTREKLWQEAQADKRTTAKTFSSNLTEALHKQQHPDKSRWASYLDLGAGGYYRLTDGGRYDGHTIHVTMSKDSWTADVDGKVSLMAGTPEAVLRKLLETKDDWMQMHATLEVNQPEYPHVFLYAGVLANDKRWEAARVALGKDAKWVKGAQKAMQDLLDAVKKRLEGKIAEARKDQGQSLY